MRRGLFIAAFLAVAYSIGFAQDNLGVLTGIVSDADQGAVPGAVITAVNIESRAIYKTISSVTGSYTLS